jgi:ferric-dicitrate binding protein FerR (iron transport regulator)
MSLDSHRQRIVDQQAAYWYCRWFDEGQMPRADRMKFVKWLRLSPENVAAILRIADLDGMLVRRKLLDCIEGLQKSNIIQPDFATGPGKYDYQPSRHVSNQVPRSKVAGKAWWKPSLWKAVAVLTLAVAAPVSYLGFRTPEGVVETRAAQWQRMTLDDGSTIHLDARTRIKVEYTDGQRIVHLERGWVVCDVMKDSRRPFIVRTRHVDVTAVGTRYGVAIDNGVRATVEEGVVEVKARDGRTGSSVLLQKGQQLFVQPADHSTLSVASIAEVDAGRELSWVTGRLEMSNTTLGEIVRQFNRRQKIQAEIKDAQLANRKIDLALMQVDNVDDFVEVMESQGVTVIRDGSTLILRAASAQ